MFEVRMPKLGAGEIGIVLRWHVEVGDRIVEGQPLAEIMTDKVTVDMESPASGTVRNLLVPTDEEIAVGSVIAEIEP